MPGRQRDESGSPAHVLGISRTLRHGPFQHPFSGPKGEQIDHDRGTGEGQNSWPRLGRNDFAIPCTTPGAGNAMKPANDRPRVYLAGRNEAAALVFYAVSRVPDLWAAAVTLGGSPQPAIDSDRLYAANFSQVPVLWVGGSNDRPAAERLQAAGLNLTFRPADSTTVGATLEWIGQHTRPEYPDSIDCETTSPSFAGRSTSISAAC